MGDNSELLLDISFNPDEDIINEEDEQEFEESNAASNSHHHSAHVRRYSAPWDSKKLTNDEFGSDYDQLHSSYWKNSGSRGLRQVDDENEYNNDDDDGKLDKD